MAPFQMIVHGPQSGEGREALRRRAAGIHADAVRSRLAELTCPERQKQELLEAVIAAVRKRMDSI